MRLQQQLLYRYQVPRYQYRYQVQLGSSCELKNRNAALRVAANQEQYRTLRVLHCITAVFTYLTSKLRRSTLYGQRYCTQRREILYYCIIM